MQRHVANTDLCALVDGECSAAERARIEAELAGSPQCAERLAAWRRNDAALRAALRGGPVETLGRGLSAAAGDETQPLRLQPDGAAATGAKRGGARLKAAVFSAFAGGSAAAGLALATLLLARQ